MPKTTWTPNQLSKLYELREQGLAWQQISSKIKKSANSCASKFSRIKWDEFIKDPEGYHKSSELQPKIWSHDEMVQLDAFLKSGKSYSFIADQMNRSIVSVERQAQTTDWQAWNTIKDVVEEDEIEDVGVMTERLVDALLTIARFDTDRVKTMTRPYFLEKINLDKEELFLNFEELKNKASQRLIEIGFGNPEEMDLGEGTYIIVGDSHGKHTKKDMFKLLKQANKYLSPKKIIHIGHILDDDDDISYDWGDFSNLVVLSKIEELKIVQAMRNKFKFSYEIVREAINIGDLTIVNQDLIQDYVKTSIKNVTSEIVDSMAIINCHRLEFFTRTAHDKMSYIASPGCICEEHIVKTVKQMDFTDGKHVKQAFPDGFIKYRRMKHMNKYWDNALIIVRVNSKMEHTIIPCPIKKTDKGFTFAYFDKMIGSKGIFNPTKKIFVNADMHSNNHDTEVLDIQDQIVQDYKPDIYVNMGDTHNCTSLNHHDLDKNIPITKDFLEECAETYYILKKMASWAKDHRIIYGNHERFARDFINKFPQLGSYLDFPFSCDIKGLGYIMTELKEVLKIGSAKFVHGDVKMYGQSGTKLEKASRTFGKDVCIGHIHCPSIRLGCFSVGLTGKLDQEYNEPSASNWMHGIGLCNQYKGQSWLTTIAIVNNKCILQKTYYPKNPSKWELKEYGVRLVYDV